MEGRAIPTRPAAGPDRWLLLVVLVLVGLGIVMVYSASFRFAAVKHGNGLFFLYRQAAFAVVGLAAMAVASRLDYHVWGRKKVVYGMLLLVAGLLAAVLLFGNEINGARRWFRLGPISLQPSEPAKFAVVAFLAYGILAKKGRMKSFGYGFLPHVLIPGAVALLIVLEPDVGNFALIGGVVFVMLLIGGASWVHLGGLAGVAALGTAAVLAVIRLWPHVWLGRKLAHVWARLTSFADPWADPLGSGYQLIQSLIALGSGGVFGRGLGAGRQKMLFLPEMHTDFILANIGEELGLAGVVVLLVLFGIVLHRGTRIAARSTDPFGTYLAFGLTLLLGLQVVASMGVVMALLPTKGLPLPFLSYGGSSLVTNMAMAGVLLSISARGGGDDGDAANRRSPGAARPDLPPGPLPGEEA